MKILFTCLVLVLAVALGTEVAALHRAALPAPAQIAQPVVVRKAAHASVPPKTVRPLPDHPHDRPALPKNMPMHHAKATGN